MAKKTAVENTNDSEDNAINVLSESLIKKYGEGIIIPGTSIISKPKKTIPISPCIDLSLGGGLYEGSWAGFAGAPGAGKAQPLYSTVYTPDGPVKMGDLKLNQLVCCPDGDVAPIIGIFPQGEKDVYEITFSDGSKTRCCDEHLWKVHAQNGLKSGVLSTSQIRKKIKFNCGKRIYSIDMTEPVYFKAKQHYINPYLLGILISEGSLFGSVKFSSTDDEVITKVCKIIPNGYSVKKHGTNENKCDYRISRDKENGHFFKKSPDLVKELKRLGLYAKYSFEKFIPYEYMIDSVENRIELIRGLMDGDGTVDKRGHACSYSTSSKELAENFKFIIESIGGKCRILEKNPTYTYNGQKLEGKMSYTCSISINNMSQLFSLSRKKNLIREKSKRFTRRFIESIDFIGKEECQCIMVDSADSLYLTDSFIVTHNTTLCLQIAKNAQQQGREIFYLNVEARLKTMNLLGIKGLNAEKVNVINYVDRMNLSGEDFLMIAEDIIKTVKNAVIIIDSVSSLCPSNEMATDVSGSIRPTSPKMLSHFIRKNTGNVYINNCTILMIHHVITNTSGYGAKWQISDGLKVNFQADVRLQAKGTPADWMDGDTQVGQIVEWEISKSNNSASVGTTRSFIRYGIGIDDSAELFNLGVDFGIIKKAGAWYECPLFMNEDKPMKVQGQERFLNYLNENPESINALREKVMSFS